MIEPKCLRCGQCCHYELDGIEKQCKYLIVFSEHKTACAVYSRRMFVRIDKNVWCNPRESVPNKYKGCPYNK